MYVYVLICASYLYILEDSNIIPATLSGPASGGSEGGLSGGFIAGIAAAVLVLVAALAAAVWYFKSKRYLTLLQCMSEITKVYT